MKRIHAFSPIMLVLAVVGTLQAQFPFTPLSATLEANKVRAQINSNGVLFTDFVRGQFVPVHPGLAEQPLIRSAGLWVMGRDETGNLRGSVQVSGGVQQTDYRSGVLIDISFNAMSGVTCGDVQAHRSDWADNGVIDNPNPNVYGWLGFGNPFLPIYYKHTVGNPQWWLGGHGYIDENGNGLYSPHQGDYPAPTIWGCHAAPTIPEIHYTFPYTDANANTVSGTSPIGIQVHEQIFAYKTVGGSSPLDRAIIVASRVVHRGFDFLDSVYFGMHIDFDLGNPNDDFMGSTTTPNMLFAYNGDNDDEGGFGTNMPAVGAVLLRGPLDLMGQPAPLQHLMVLPQVNDLSGQGYYNLLQGRFPDGTPAPNNGQMFLGDPTLPGSASEVQAGNTPGTRVGLASFGPIKMAPSAVNEMIVAFFYTYEPGRTPQEQASRLIQEAQEIKEAFDNCFADVSTSCDYVLGTRTPMLRQNALKVFPTPANAVLHVRPEVQGLRNLSLTDALGATVLETRVGDNTEQLQLDTGQLPAGMYLLRATFADGSVSATRVVVQH